MSKVILTIFKYGRENLVSMKCKDEKRASEIAANRPNCIRWQFYHAGVKIPAPKKKLKNEDPILEKIRSGEINMDGLTLELKRGPQITQINTD